MPAFRDAKTNEINFLLSKSPKERIQMCKQIKHSECFDSKRDAVCWRLEEGGVTAPPLGWVEAGLDS